MADGEGKDDTADNPILNQLTAQLSVLEKRAAISEARRKLFNLTLDAANLPVGNYPVGNYKINPEVSPIEGIILAHEAMTALTKEVAQRVKDKGVTRVHIQNAADGKLLAALAVLNIQLEAIEMETTAALHTSGRALGDAVGIEFAAFVPGLGAILNSTVQLAGLFRADREVTNAKIDLNPHALVCSLVGALLEKGVTVSEGVGLPKTQPYPPPGDSLTARMLRLVSLRQQLSTDSARIATKQAEPQPAQPNQPDPAGAPLKVEGKPPSVDQQALTAAGTGISAALTKLDTFISTLTTPNQATGTSPLGEALTAEKLANFLNTAGTYLLVCEAQAGGASKTTKTVFKSTLTFSGGAVVSFTLSDRDGVLKDAATLTAHSGFIGIDSLGADATRLRTWTA